MRSSGLLLAMAALVGTLGGCPALVGIDSDYSAGGGGVPDGGASSSFDGNVRVDSGDHDSGKHDASVHDTGTHDVGRAETTTPTGDGGHGVDALQAMDGEPPSDTGAPPSDACPAACSLAAPAGWTLVAFETSTSSACPTGFTDTDVVEPTNGGSCVCGGCAVTTDPDCETGTIDSMWNETGTTCDATGGYFAAGGGVCQVMQLGNAGYSSFTGPAPTGGACTSSPTATNPTSTAEHFCTPTGCPSDVCGSGVVAAGFEACLYQTGDQTCPSTATTKHAIGASATASCGACDCSVSASGCDGTMSIYNSTAGCGGTVSLSVPANGTCTSLAGISEGASYVYTATPSNVVCNAGTSTATPTVVGAGTVCCP